MIKNFRVLKSLFLVEENGILKQVLNVQIDNSGPAAAGKIRAEVAGSASSDRKATAPVAS